MLVAFFTSGCERSSSPSAAHYRIGKKYTGNEVGVSQYVDNGVTCIYSRTIKSGSLYVFSGRAELVSEGLHAAPASFVNKYINSMDLMWSGLKKAVQVEPQDSYFVINQNENSESRTIFVSAQSGDTFIFYSVMN